MKSKRYLSFFLAFILSFAVNITSVFAAGNLKVHFIDVGQADSILVQSPNGKKVYAVHQDKLVIYSNSLCTSSNLNVQSFLFVQGKIYR